jgi:hypothetical protein
MSSFYFLSLKFSLVSQNELILLNALISIKVSSKHNIVGLNTRECETDPLKKLLNFVSRKLCLFAPIVVTPSLLNINSFTLTVK